MGVFSAHNKTRVENSNRPGNGQLVAGSSWIVGGAKRRGSAEAMLWLVDGCTRPWTFGFPLQDETLGHVERELRR